jgi:MinD superfamily P-loop ATPase
MKQLVILSGKGGTGKTSVTAAFVHLSQAGSLPVPAVLVDADVDAANLELALGPETVESHDFLGGLTAIIDPHLCQGCGICEQVCRFEAVQLHDGYYSVDPLACEGCAACRYQCPEDSIRMEQQRAGSWFRSQTRFGPLFHAALRPAQENSGKLVTLVKQQARLLAMDEAYPVVLVDGPPGIGCPVISAVSGADLALIVTEPTAAGIHDMQRALATTTHFRIPTLVCVNKFDLYPAGAEQIEANCLDQGIPLLASVPFDPIVTEAMAHGEPVTAYCPSAPASLSLMELWEQVVAKLNP